MCVLAYLMERILERKLAAAGFRGSVTDVLDRLSPTRASQVVIGQKRLICRTEADLGLAPVWPCPPILIY